MASRRPRLTIPTRIFLSFALVLIAFGLVAGTSLWQHQRSAATLRVLHEGYLPLALTLGQSKATQAVFGTLLDRVLSERDPTATRSWLDAARRVRPATLRRARATVERAERLAPDDDDRAVLRDIAGQLEAVQATYTESDPRFDTLFASIEAGRLGEAAPTLEALRRAEQDNGRRLRVAWGLVQARIAQISRESAERERQTLYEVALLALLALLAGAGVTWWSQRLLSPLPRLERRVAAVARGDLDERIDAARDDEIGQLTVQFERMVDAVAARDGDLRKAAESLRELQRMQEQIVAGLRSAVVVVDAEGIIRSANDAAERVLGLDQAALGRSLAEHSLGERLPGLLEAVQAIVSGTERAELQAITLAPEPGGEARQVDVLATPFGAPDDGEAGRAVLLVADDVTEALRTKARLIQNERLAAIGRMAAHVTHEVRNPLSSIGLNVELLADEVGDRDSEAAALLGAIEKEIDRLTAITEEYLRLARLPEPRLEIEPPDELVEEVLHFVRRELDAAGVTPKVEIETDLPLVALDEAQLRQALLNLLRNASEAMPEGGELDVAVRRASGGVEITIADRGPGIPEPERAKIFELFYSTKARGTGLGLSLTQEIVAAHGGQIRCEERAGGGTVFAIWLPEPEASSSTPPIDERAEATG